MTIDRRYKGTSKRIIVAWKVFYREEDGMLRPQFYHTSLIIKRRKWIGPSRRPGFHAYKKRPSHTVGYPYVTKKVLLRGLLGEGPYHYTAKYLWVGKKP